MGDGARLDTALGALMETASSAAAGSTETLLSLEMIDEGHRMCAAGRPEAARRLWRAALHSRPSRPLVYRCVWQIYRMLGDNEEAAHIQRCLEARATGHLAEGAQKGTPPRPFFAPTVGMPDYGPAERAAPTPAADPPSPRAPGGAT